MSRLVVIDKIKPIHVFYLLNIEMDVLESNEKGVLKSDEKETLHDVQVDEVIPQKTELNEEGHMTRMSMK